MIQVHVEQPLQYTFFALELNKTIYMTSFYLLYDCSVSQKLSSTSDIYPISSTFHCNFECPMSDIGQKYVGHVRRFWGVFGFHIYVNGQIFRYKYGLLNNLPKVYTFIVAKLAVRHVTVVPDDFPAMLWRHVLFLYIHKPKFPFFCITL